MGAVMKDKVELLVNIRLFDDLMWDLSDCYDTGFHCALYWDNGILTFETYVDSRTSKNSDGKREIKFTIEEFQEKIPEIKKELISCFFEKVKNDDLVDWESDSDEFYLEKEHFFENECFIQGRLPSMRNRLRYLSLEHILSFSTCFEPYGDLFNRFCGFEINQGKIKFKYDLDYSDLKETLEETLVNFFTVFVDYVIDLATVAVVD